MKSLPLVSLFLIYALILLAPTELNATDRASKFKTKSSPDYSTNTKKRSFFSMLFGNKNRQPNDDAFKSSVTAIAPRTKLALSRSIQESANLQQSTQTVQISQNDASEAAAVTKNQHIEQLSGDPKTPALTQAIKVSNISNAQISLGSADLENDLSVEKPSVNETELPSPMFAQPVHGRPGLVYLPGLDHVPANMVDVSGLHPGAKVRDPISQMVFLVP